MIQIYQNSALKALGPQPKIPVAISIAFYNNTKFLDLTLASLSRQSMQNFEIIICDDGSRPEAVEHAQAELEKLAIAIATI
jgi:glycosyltransferase involved in cell wall biosynthesis